MRGPFPDHGTLCYHRAMTRDQRIALIFLLLFGGLMLAILPLYNDPVLMLYLERWGLC